jgi:hypothetical protein
MKTYEFNWVQTSQETEKDQRINSIYTHARLVTSYYCVGCETTHKHTSYGKYSLNVNSDVSLQPKLL